MKDIGDNEEIPADVTPMPTPKKPQLAQERPVPVYMVKTYNCDTDSGNDSSDSDNDRAEANKNYVISICMTV